jgi:hypothetical protein
LTVQLAVEALAAASGHVVLSNEPFVSLEEKLTVPVGVTGLGSVSVTVAVHAVEPLVLSDDGVQETAVVVARLETVRDAEPLLAWNVALPP